ncbi:hypothetical protein B0O80DRAFT_429228 [Mortierella sp. GBAus27b]|nr:hypothetical protein B0O80DRAFT_429228 [Mortierella sp. GBAus27b]
MDEVNEDVQASPRQIWEDILPATYEKYPDVVPLSILEWNPESSLIGVGHRQRQAQQGHNVEWSSGHNPEPLAALEPVAKLRQSGKGVQDHGREFQTPEIQTPDETGASKKSNHHRRSGG